MAKKNARMEVLKMIISSQELGTQEELIRELTIAGYSCNQSTLSRDLKQLHVLKVQNTEGKYVYMLPGREMYRNVTDTHVTLHSLQRLGVLGVRFSGNMAVVKTLPGYAGRVGYDIDNADIPQVLGTIAGDDCVLVVLCEDAARDQVLDQLSAAIPYIK